MTHDITAYDNLSFPAGSTLVVDGADKLPADGVDPDLKSVVLIEVTGALTNPPEPQLAVPATKGWRVKWSGKRLRAVRESGLVLIVK